jgi:ethanolaminephosphotransferase
MPFAYFTAMQIPLFIGAIVANAPYWLGRSLWTSQHELFFLWAYLAFVLVAYLHWALVVIDAFCKHLKIKCLSIPHGKKR